MGYRLHVQSKHDIEYSHNEYFGLSTIELFNTILNKYYNDTYVDNYNDDGQRSIELDKVEFHNMINEVKKHKEEVTELINELNSIYKTMPFTYELLIDSLTSIFENSCVGHTIYLDWF